MSPTDLTTALTEVRDAVEAPPVDRVALQARVRAERRRRTTNRAAAGVLGAAAVAVAAVGVTGVLRDVAPPTTDVAAGPVAEPQHLVGFVVEGRLVVGGPDGYDETEVPARNVLGDLTDTVVVVDGTGALAAVRVEDGRARPAQRLLPGVVDFAWLDAAGDLYAQRADGTLVRPSLADGWETETAPVDNLLDVDGRSRLESAASGLTLRRDRQVVRRIPAGGGLIDQSLRSGVLAVETQRSLRFYDAVTGRRTATVPAGTNPGAGELSQDGSRYARVADGALTLVDPRTGAVAPVAVPAAEASYPGDVAWTSADTFVVVARGSAGSSLWECATGPRSCIEVYADPTGTLQLHS